MASDAVNRAKRRRPLIPNHTPGRGLPKPKFTDAEQRAYDWLWASGITGWLVDLMTKRVCDVDGGDWPGLVQFATSKGWSI